MRCPICGHSHLGVIGINRYFCRECCHEMVLSKNKSQCYYPGANGDIRQVGRVDETARIYRQRAV